MRIDDHAFVAFAEWLNAWGDLDASKHERHSRPRSSPSWRDGYQDAIRDVYKRFSAVPTRLDPEDDDE